ncbi:MAG: hypothetical protein O2954_12110, partial [bacterium]|nr:hypothetical protein [bacterium]
PQGGPMGPPSGGQGGHQGGPMGPPPGGHQMGGPQGGPQGGPMGGPQGGSKGEPSPEEMKKMYEQWRRSPEAKDLNGDRQVNEEDFKIFTEKMMKQGGPQGGPMGPPSGGQGGHQGGPMGPPPGGHQMGGSQGGPMGGHQMSGHQGGPQGGPMGGPQGDYPNPQKLIETLPAGLQPSFNKTLATEREAEKAHMDAELKMLTSVRQTLEETKRYLVKASDAEKDQILQVLSFFDRQGPQDGPGMGPGGSGMGGPGMGQGRGAGKATSPANAEDLVRKMIEDTDREIENLKQMMQEMGR